MHMVPIGEVFLPQQPRESEDRERGRERRRGASLGLSTSLIVMPFVLSLPFPAFLEHFEALLRISIRPTSVIPPAIWELEREREMQCMVVAVSACMQCVAWGQEGKERYSHAGEE